MSLGVSNTFLTPLNTTSIGTARGQTNSSLRAILQNFFAQEAPNSLNIIFEGINTTPPLGTLFISANTQALYRKVDGTSGLYSSPGGRHSTQNFTRRGISYRVEANETSAQANIALSYEVGETFFRLDNNKYYFKNSSGNPVELVSGTTSIDNNSITSAKLATGGLIHYDSLGHLSVGNSSSTVRTEANLIVKPDNSQFPINILLEPSSHTTSRRAAIGIDSWLLLQDSSGNGSKNFIMYNTITGRVPIFVSDDALRVGLAGCTNPAVGLGVSSSVHISDSLTIGGTLQSFSGATRVVDDIMTYRSTDPNTGAVFLNNTGTKYLWYNGESFILNGGDLVTSGNITAYSDLRLKKDITSIDGLTAINKIKNMSGYYYTRIDTQERHIGLLAQEVEKILPEVVSKKGEYLSVAYGNIIAILIEAIKEQQKQIERLIRELT